jgi:hypothetical protein
MTDDPFHRISTSLAALRRRLDRRDAGEAAWAGTLAIAAGLLLGLAASFVLGRGAGRYGWVPIGLGLITAAWCHWTLGWRPRGARATDDDLARWLERRRPELRSGVITAVQVRGALRDGAPWPGLS